MDIFNRHHSFTPSCCGILIFCLLSISSAHGKSDAYAEWDATLTPAAKVPFPKIVPFDAEYRFGWEGVGAGGAKVHVVSRANGRRFMSGQGGPNAWIRRLWNYQALYVGESGGNGELPCWFRIDEGVSRGGMLSEAYFNEEGFMTSHRGVKEPAKPWDDWDVPRTRDLFSAMLFVRSQPLKNGDHLRLVVFPDRNPYLVDLTVAGREFVTVMGKEIPAIRFTLHIQTIETKGEHKGHLYPHRRFRAGRVWMSDDAKRLPVRAEVDLWIGRIFAEIVSFHGAADAAPGTK